MRILMVGADRMEFAGILKHVGSAQTTPIGVDWSRQGELSGNTLLLAANGAGAKRAGAAVDLSLAWFSAEAIVSTGFCGALSPDLAVADIVEAADVSDGVRRFPVLPVTSGRAYHRGL